MRTSTTRPNFVLRAKASASSAVRSHFAERGAGRQQQGDGGVARVRRGLEVAGLLGHLERAALQLDAAAEVFGPDVDHLCEAEVDGGLEAERAPLLHQIEAQLAEAERRFVVVEVRPQDLAQEHVGLRRAVAVAVFETEVRRARDGEAAQVLVGERSGGRGQREDVHRRAPHRVGHRRLVDQLLDRTAAQQRPHPREFPLHLFVRRMRGPRDADAPQVGEARLDRPRGLPDGRVQVHLQTRHGGRIDQVRGVFGQNDEPALGRLELAGQEFAPRSLELERKRELGPARPSLRPQDLRARHEIPERRGIGRGPLGALARQQIELGDPALAPRPT